MRLSNEANLIKEKKPIANRGGLFSFDELGSQLLVARSS